MFSKTRRQRVSRLASISLCPARSMQLPGARFGSATHLIGSVAPSRPTPSCRVARSSGCTCALMWPWCNGRACRASRTMGRIRSRWTLTVLPMTCAATSRATSSVCSATVWSRAASASRQAAVRVAMPARASWRAAAASLCAASSPSRRPISRPAANPSILPFGRCCGHFFGYVLGSAFGPAYGCYSASTF